MKKIAVIAAMFVMGVFITPIGKAQVSVQINIGSQPGWGPTGYDYAPYYYFPDYNFYYDVSRAQYIIPGRNNWTYIKNIPSSYRFDPYNSYKVVVYRRNPYKNNSADKRNYAKYKGQGSHQPMIRDSKAYKYYESKGHPNHNQWSQQSNNNNNSGRASRKNNQQKRQQPAENNNTNRRR